jgi:hypothetical protein
MHAHAPRLAGLALLVTASAASAALQVVSVSPAANSMAAPTAVITVTFDKAVDTATIDTASFRVFGKATGAKSGVLSFGAGDTQVIFTPSAPFSAGEVVQVNLSNDIVADDADPIRTAGYSFGFMIQAVPSGASFTQITSMSNRTGGPSGPQTRIYGANASDFDEDGFIDLATVNEVSADVRVFLNAGTGSVAYDPFLTPQAIGVESSPNDAGDFDNDGHVDLAVAAATSGIVTVLLGSGDGNFSSRQDIDVGDEPHGIQALDVDGDGDLDLVNCNYFSDDMSLMLNDGNGAFGAPSFFDSGLTGEYGLASGDMNGDGITDLVVAGREDGDIRSLLGNGDGTFTGAAIQSSGGWTWVVQIGDVDGDLDLDASTANSFSNNGAIIKNNGDGTFAAPVTSDAGAHTPSTDLADLDGDGDLDWILSSFGGGYWRFFTNDGTGTFTSDGDVDAPANPSCAVPVDMDNDGDIDLALTDEIADRVVLMRNEGAGGPSPLCPETPTPGCRAPASGGKSLLLVKDRSDDVQDRLIWKWLPGAATDLAEFGDPAADEDYALCVYDGTTRVFSGRADAGGTCAGKPCWKATSTGFKFKNKALSPDGTLLLLLKSGADGAAKIVFKGKGDNLLLPPLAATGPMTAELRQSSGAVCWGATYSSPFLVNDGATFKDKAD